MYDFCLAAWKSKLVSRKCNMLPYGTGISCCAFIAYFDFFLLLLSFPFYTFLKSGIDKLMERSTIPACPSLMCFLNRGNTEGTNFLKILCLKLVYVCFI